MSRMRKVATANLKSLGQAVGATGKKLGISKDKHRSASIDEGSGSSAPKTPVLDRIARLDISSRSSSFSISEEDENETLGSIDDDEEEVDKELELYAQYHTSPSPKYLK